VEITTETVKELREITSAGIIDCRNALRECNGDVKKAIEYLKEKGFSKAAKKANRSTGQGIVECYIHGGGRIGGMIELNCETDFVGRTDEFKKLAKEIAMQIAAMNPQYLNAEDAPEGTDKNEILLSQAYIRDASQTIHDLIVSTIAKTGENIRIKQFARFEIGA